MESTAFIPQAWVPLHAAIYFSPDQRFILSTTLASGTLVNLEEDTDVTIENDMNDYSLQVSFDDDDVNNSSIQVSCDKEARDNSLFNISFEEVDQGTTKSNFPSWSPCTFISWELIHLFSVGISWQLPQEHHSHFPRCENMKGRIAPSGLWSKLRIESLLLSLPLFSMFTFIVGKITMPDYCYVIIMSKLSIFQNFWQQNHFQLKWIAN